MVNREFEKEIIKKTGSTRQQVVAMEECGELIQAISKSLRYECSTSESETQFKKNLAEEIADVSICLERLKLIHDISDEDIQKWIDIKEKRDAGRYAKYIDEDISAEYSVPDNIVKDLIFSHFNGDEETFRELSLKVSNSFPKIKHDKIADMILQYCKNKSK